MITQKSTILLHETSYNLVEVRRRFGGMYSASISRLYDYSDCALLVVSLPYF
jgi:hypothetical protein